MSRPTSLVYWWVLQGAGAGHWAVLLIGVAACSFDIDVHGAVLVTDAGWEACLQRSGLEMCLGVASRWQRETYAVMRVRLPAVSAMQRQTAKQDGIR